MGCSHSSRYLSDSNKIYPLKQRLNESYLFTISIPMLCDNTIIHFVIPKLRCDYTYDIIKILNKVCKEDDEHTRKKTNYYLFFKGTTPMLKLTNLDAPIGNICYAKKFDIDVESNSDYTF